MFTTYSWLNDIYKRLLARDMFARDDYIRYLLRVDPFKSQREMGRDTGVDRMTIGRIAKGGHNR